MLPTEEYSGDATQGPPWTPLVWQEGPDKLVADAQAAIFEDYGEITNGILGGDDHAISGPATGKENETDQVIAPAPQSRTAVWQDGLKDLRRDEPLAAWATGTHDGPANPGA